MRLLCDGLPIHLLYDNEKNSMLIAGGSRMGKTYFISNWTASLIHLGKEVHFIELGGKWSSEDKQRLQSAGADIRNVAEGLTLIFNSAEDLLNCAQYILNALGIRSINAVAVLKKSFKKALNISGNIFDLSTLMKILESTDGENEWAMKVCDRLDCCNEIYPIVFCVDSQKEFADTSIIWNLEGLEDAYVQLIAYLITYCLFCKRRRSFKNDIIKKSYIIIDEFQALNCDRHSIIGTCLTEGQKYGLSLILATQFLDGNFSDAVISQFKQGGFRFYFRLTEEEAAIISRQLAFDSKSRLELYKQLIRLPVGHCLLIGPHMVGTRNTVSEDIRFIEISAD